MIEDSTAKEMLKNGWKFTYDKHTIFVGADHPNGGRQSICEIKQGYDTHKWGYLIAELLNNA